MGGGVGGGALLLSLPDPPEFLAQGKKRPSISQQRQEQKLCAITMKIGNEMKMSK